MKDLVVRSNLSVNLRAGVLWVKEDDLPLVPGDRLRILNHKYQVRGEAEVASIERFIEAELHGGRGRKRGEVLQKVGLVRGEDGWRI